MINCTLTALLVSLIISFLIGRSWIKKTKRGDVILNAEALRNPINTGITVAGFLLPIIVGLISYLFLENNVRIHKEYYLYSSTLLIIISIFFGLWNNYALATLTKSDGSFPITKTDNTTFPAFFVFQLSMLFLGILFLGIFSLKNITPKEVANKNKISTEQIKLGNQLFISKPYIGIKTSKDLLLRNWGQPTRVLRNDSLLVFLYNSTLSEFSFTIKKDTIININQKLKR